MSEEFVIVLGHPDISTCKSRVAVAVKYVKENKRSSRMFFGGCEADNMKKYAEELNYWKSIPINGDVGLSTYENIKFILQQLQEIEWFHSIFDNRYVFTICTSKYNSSQALLIALSLLNHLSATVQIIHDEDEGDEFCRREEERSLIDYAKLLIRTKHSPYKTEENDAGLLLIRT